MEHSEVRIHIEKNATLGDNLFQFGGVWEGVINFHKLEGNLERTVCVSRSVGYTEEPLCGGKAGEALWD